MENRKSERGFIHLEKPILPSRDLLQIDIENNRIYRVEDEEWNEAEEKEHIGSLTYRIGLSIIYIDVYATEDNHLIVCVNTEKGNRCKEHRRVLIPLLPL